MAGLTEGIAEFITTKGLADFPAGAVDNAKRVIADTVGVILAGAVAEVSEPLLTYAAGTGATGNAVVLGTSLRTSPEVAAMLNGTFGHALDFDDVLTMMPGHPSAVIMAALLATAARRPVSGKEIVEAYVIGIEVGAKIGLGITVGHYNRGFHGTSSLGIFSALAALCKLERLDVATTRMAFGIASSMSSGVRRNFGTMTKPLHTGWAARCAFTAVDLARSGFTAALDALETGSGFFAAYGVEGSDPAKSLEALGKPWAVVDPGIGLKKWPCYNGSQRAMDGLLTLRGRLGFDETHIDRVECRMPPRGMHVLIYPRPNTGLEGKFSMPYCLAAGIVDGQYGLPTFTDEAVNRPVIRALMEKIAVREEDYCGGNDPLMATKVGGSRGFVEIEVWLKDGRRDMIRVERAPGHPSRPLGWEEVGQKFLNCAAYGGIAKDRAQSAWNALKSLDTAANVTEITDHLIKG